MTSPDKLRADELKLRAKEMNRLRQAKYRASRAQDDDWKAQNRERNRIRKQRQREREKAARPKGTGTRRRQPLRRGARIVRSTQVPKAVSKEIDVNSPKDASNESANVLRVTQEPHESRYRFRTERSMLRNEQQNEATNLDIEEANAAESLTILQVSVRDSTTNGNEKQHQTFKRYEETAQHSEELYEAEEDTIEDQGEETERQSQESQFDDDEEYIRGQGIWRNFRSMTDSYLHKVLNQK